MKRFVLVLLALGASLAPLTAQQNNQQEAKIDVSGEWELSVESPQGPMAIAAHYKQAGEKLTGRHVNEFGEVPLAGTVKGSDISYTITIDVQGQQVAITHTGKIDGDTITGTADLGGMGTVNWTGKRKK